MPRRESYIGRMEEEPAAKDRFYFLKLFFLVIISLGAGINLLTSGWTWFIINMIFAILLSIKMANSYDAAWDRKP